VPRCFEYSTFILERGCEGVRMYGLPWVETGSLSCVTNVLVCFAASCLHRKGGSRDLFNEPVPLVNVEGFGFQAMVRLGEQVRYSATFVVLWWRVEWKLHIS
jgi:hypothetical protein